MPPCNKAVEIRSTKLPTDEAFLVHCIDSEGHEGIHQAHVWILGDNKATGQKGHFTTVAWQAE